MASRLTAACVTTGALLLVNPAAWADPPGPGNVIVTSANVWDRANFIPDSGNLRGTLDSEGITLGGSWIMEGFDDFQGGAERGIVGASTLDANLALDLQKLFGVEGGEFYVDIEDHAGRDPDALAGDLQSIDKLDWSAYFQVFEFWYEEKLLGGQLRVKIGKIDGNSEFSIIDKGLDFLDASTQVTPTLLAFTTTPDPMPTLDVFYTPHGSPAYAAFSIADANRNDRLLDFSGRPWAIQPTEHGQLLIAETGLTWKQFPGLSTDGNFRFGAWDHTGSFPRLGGGAQDGARGIYAIFDQTLWQPGAGATDMRGLRTFLEYGQTEARVSTLDLHYGGGLAWTGPFASRAQDVTGISAEIADVSDRARLPYRAESLFESFYQLQLTGWMTVQPDLQFIVHPGGQYPSAWIGILKMQITL